MKKVIEKFDMTVTVSDLKPTTRAQRGRSEQNEITVPECGRISRDDDSSSCARTAHTTANAH